MAKRRRATFYQLGSNHQGSVLVERRKIIALRVDLSECSSTAVHPCHTIVPVCVIASEDELVPSPRRLRSSESRASSFFRRQISVFFSASLGELFANFCQA